MAVSGIHSTPYTGLSSSNKVPLLADLDSSVTLTKQQPSSKRPQERLQEMEIPSAEFKHQRRHSEAITLLNDLENQRREVVARQEQEIAQLKYNISQLRSENNYLRTALSIPSPESVPPSNNLAQELQLMTRHAQRLGLRTDGRHRVHELGGLGRILCDIWCLENLEIFLEGEPRQKPGGVYCLGYIGSGGCYPRFKLSSDGLLRCPYHEGGISGGCVWIMKDEVGWVIGSVPPRPTSDKVKHEGTE